MAKKFVQNFTTDELKKLANDNASCVCVQRSIYNLELYPYHLSDIASSIKELLNAKIAKYNQKLNGILLGYKNLKLLTPQGAIVFDSCYIHIDVEGEFYVFKPEIDSSITGIVNKKSNNHVGCLVHRLFNVSVPNTEGEGWNGHNVNVGDEVVLKIVYMDLDARLPYIKAELISIKQNTSAEESHKKTKKRNKIKLELLEESGENFKTDETDLKKKLKKKKKYITDNIETVESIGKLDPEESLSKKKKRKKHKSEESINSNASLSDFNNLVNHKIVENKLETSKSDKKVIQQKLEKKKNRKSQEALESSNQGVVNIREEVSEKKRKSRELLENSNQVTNSQKDITDEQISEKKKKRRSKEIHNHNLEINNELTNGESLKNLVNKLSDSEQITEKLSDKEKKRKSSELNKSNSEIKQEVIEKNMDVQLTEQKLGKKKRKSYEKSTNSVDNDIPSLEGEDLFQLLCNESPKHTKKRKSEEHKSNLESISNHYVNSTIMADREDRKSIKGKSSPQNIIWNDEELDLHDTELEKTLESWAPEDKSFEVNLVKIAALNESNKLERNIKETEVDDQVKSKKRKRKSEETGQKTKKVKVETLIADEPKKKTKKVKT